MSRLNEHEIAQGYVGKPINTEKLNQCFTHIDNNEYHAFCNDYYEETEWDLFKLTDALYTYWEDSGIDFRVILHIKGEKVINCKIYKHKDDLGGFCGRPVSEDLVPSQQEIRIFRRIMDYITT